MQNAATTANLKRHLFIWLILWPNVLFHNSGSQPIFCSLTTFQYWINTVLELAHWKWPAITHAGKAMDSGILLYLVLLLDCGRENKRTQWLISVSSGDFHLGWLDLCWGDHRETFFCFPASRGQAIFMFSSSFSFLLGLILFFQAFYYCHLFYF